MAKSIDCLQLRSQRGRLGAYTSWARAEDRTAHTLPGCRAIVEENELDPKGRLTIQERAEHTCKADTQRMALKAEQVRRGRRQS